MATPNIGAAATGSPDRNWGIAKSTAGTTSSSQSAASQPRTARKPAVAQPPSGTNPKRTPTASVNSHATSSPQEGALLAGTGKNGATAMAATAPTAVTRQAAKVGRPGVAMTQRSPNAITATM